MLTRLSEAHAGSALFAFTGLSARYDEIGDLNLTASSFWFSVVVRTFISPWFERDLDGRTLNFTFDMELIPRPYGPRPTELVESGAHDAADGLDLALDQQPHGDSRGMPAARRQPAEDSVPRGVLVEMEWLRIEFGGESLDLLLVNPQSPKPKVCPPRSLRNIAYSFRISLALMYQIRAAQP